MSACSLQVMTLFTHLWQEKNTPLHLAASGGFQAITDLLLQKKGDVTCQNEVALTSDNHLEVPVLVLFLGRKHPPPHCNLGRTCGCSKNPRQATEA